MTLLPFDELRRLSSALRENPKLLHDEDIIDDILGIFVMSYKNGVYDANEMINTDIIADYSAMNSSINRDIGGKTWKDRVDEYAENEDAESVIRVMETESHRNYNEGISNTGKSSGKTLYKTWKTMLDDRVRETHDYLEGVTVKFDERFYTFDNDSALYPGDFANAENNVNCRCYISLSEG